MAVIATQTIELDMTPGGVSPFLYVSQGDYGSRNLIFNLLLNGQPYTIPAAVQTVTLSGITKKGNVFNSTCSFSGSTVTADLNADMTSDAGLDICELRFTTSDEASLGSANFFVVVEPNPTAVKVLYGNVYWSELSKSWAIGGTGLRSDEETNNSKYWSDSSKSWAVGGTYIRDGEDSDNSKYYCENAEQYRDNSKYYYENTKQYYDDSKYYYEEISDVMADDRRLIELNEDAIQNLQAQINQYLDPPAENVGEVVNARTGFDGTVYESLGVAIRSQVVKYGYVAAAKEIYFTR